MLVVVIEVIWSMGSRTDMAAVEGSVLTLLLDAYQRRNEVGPVVLSARPEPTRLGRAPAIVPVS